MSANHTVILKKAHGYAEKVTAIMQAHSHQHGIVTAIDEFFIEGLPVCPQSLLISDAGVYGKCTHENWTTFLREMENLKESLSGHGYF